MSASPSAFARKEQQAAGVIAALADLWPLTFFVFQHHRKPLKVGIDHDVFVAAKGAVTAAEIKLAVRRYCGSVGYLQACAAGAARIDLNGEAVGQVAPSEAVFAAEQLAQRKPKPARAITPAPKAPEPAKRVSLAELKATAAARKRGAA